MEVFPSIEDLRTWADRLEEVQERLAPYFEREEPRQRAMAYIRGLISTTERKNGWQLAELAGVRGETEVKHEGDRLGRAGGCRVDDHGAVLVGQAVLQVRVVGEKLLRRLAVVAEAGTDEPVHVGGVIGGADGLQPCCGIPPARPDRQAKRRNAVFIADIRIGSGTEQGGHHG